MECYSLCLDRYWFNTLKGENLLGFSAVSHYYSTTKAKQVQKIGCS